MDPLAVAKGLIDRLGIRKKISENEVELLREIDNLFTSGETDQVTRLLPLGTSCIHIWSIREKYMNARNWINEQSGTTECGTLMSSLVVLFLADMGREKYKGAGEEEVWNAIYGMVLNSITG